MRLSLVARIFRPAFHTKCLSLCGSFNCQIPPQARLGIETFEQLPLFLGMAIFARPADTRSSPTLIGRVLLGPIRNRVRYGFLKKKPETGPSRVQVLFKKPRLNPRPDPYKNPVPKITKIP